MADRLQKILARAGVASRRAAEELIVAGRVSVNGRVVTRLGSVADPAHDEIRVDGHRIARAPARTVMLHKPAGVMTTLSDPRGRQTVRDLLPKELGYVFPVGRLDYQSAGLLLLTNDGELAEALLHPRSRIARTYRVKVDGHPDEHAIARLRRGVRLDDGMTGPAEVNVEEKRPGKTWLRITIREGKRREIRRMCEAVGHLVDRLVRVRFGPIDLDRLRPGEWRPLSAGELLLVRRACGLGRHGKRAVKETRSDRTSERRRVLTSRDAAVKQSGSRRRSAQRRGVEQPGSSRGS